MTGGHQPFVDLAPPTWPAVRFANVLPRDLARMVHAATCALQGKFQASMSGYDAGALGLGSRDEPHHRRSLVLSHCPEVFGWFLPLVRALLPLACQRLTLPPFFPTATEMQITASGSGDFFRAHADNGTYRLHRRAVSYVYYYGEAELLYSGGELVLGTGAALSPRWNSIVFFPSGILHEIRPVQCPTDFSASRFTINGWMSR